MREENQLIEGNISVTILRFAVPFFISSLLQALYGAADLFVVGRYTGADAVSAVSIGSQVMQTLTGIILGISMGGTVLIGRRVGEKNGEATGKAIGTLAILFLALAAVVTPLMLSLTKQAVSLMQTPPEAVSQTEGYILICSLGIPFIIGYNAVSGIFRGLGDSKTPVYFIAVACVINIAFDFYLVGSLNLGAAGAAFATVSAQAVSFLAAVIYMWKKGFSFPFRKAYFRPDSRSAASILKVGCPLALQDALVNCSFLAITAIINTLGIIASASVGVVEKVIVFAFLPVHAFSSAVAAMTAQNMGAGKPDRALSTLRWGITYSLGLGILVCGFSQIFPQAVTGIFTGDRQVIEMAALYLRSYSIDCLLVAFVFCMNAYFSGCGNSVISMVHSLIATFAVRIPLSYGLSRMAGVTLFEMGFAAPAASLVSIVICFGYFIRMKQKK